MAVVAGALAALLVGFVAGYLCGRKCRKDEDDNLPYPDTEYEYFEQRQNVNRYATNVQRRSVNGEYGDWTCEGCISLF